MLASHLSQLPGIRLVIREEERILNGYGTITYSTKPLRHIYEKLAAHLHQSLLDTIDSLALEHHTEEA